MQSSDVRRPTRKLDYIAAAGGITIGPITCGGYVVSAAWIVYLIWCISFQDPLKVLAEREAAEVRQAALEFRKIIQALFWI